MISMSQQYPSNQALSQVTCTPPRTRIERRFQLIDLSQVLDNGSNQDLSGRASTSFLPTLRQHDSDRFDYQPSIAEKNKSKFKLPTHPGTDLKQERPKSYFRSKDRSVLNNTEILPPTMASYRSKSNQNSSHSTP